MYANTFKNELTTDQKGYFFKYVWYFILLSYKTYTNCTGFIAMVFIWFNFFLNIPVNNFSVMSAHSTKIKMLGSREGVADGPDPLFGKSETFGTL